MVGVVFAIFFFGFTTAVLTKEVVLLWHLGELELKELFGARWRGTLNRRMRIATPGGLLLSSSLLVASIVVATASVLGLPSWLFIASLVLMGTSGIAAFSALALGIPKILVLPAFRSRTEFQSAVRGRSRR